jgi:transposase
VKKALAASAPPRYERARKGSIVDPVEPQIRTLLAEFPTMPASGHGADRLDSRAHGAVRPDRAATAAVRAAGPRIRATTFGPRDKGIGYLLGAADERRS